MRKIDRNAVLVVLVNYRRQTMASAGVCSMARCQCGTCPFYTGILDNKFGCVSPDFSGGGSPKQLAPRSGQFSSLAHVPLSLLIFLWET